MSDQPPTERVTCRFAVHVMPKSGILDPQGRAVEQSLPHLGVTGVRDVRVGRRVELTVEAADEAAALAVVERLAHDLLANPLIEACRIEPIGAVAGTEGVAVGAVAGTEGAAAAAIGASTTT
jgi:phosphoribosylformylglycinamidine synthase